ncbi:hypothetical protein Q8A73_009033 [Channa argus]|nr:hypothetical protein Q8A73_009033 [Channa argus]
MPGWRPARLRRGAGGRQPTNSDQCLSVNGQTKHRKDEEKDDGLCPQTEHVVTVCGCREGDGVDERMESPQLLKQISRPIRAPIGQCVHMPNVQKIIEQLAEKCFRSKSSYIRKRLS